MASHPGHGNQRSRKSHLLKSPITSQYQYDPRSLIQSISDILPRSGEVYNSARDRSARKSLLSLFRQQWDQTRRWDAAHWRAYWRLFCRKKRKFAKGFSSNEAASVSLTVWRWTAYLNIMEHAGYQPWSWCYHMASPRDVQHKVFFPGPEQKLFWTGCHSCMPHFLWHLM